MVSEKFLHKVYKYLLECPLDRIKYFLSDIVTFPRLSSVKFYVFLHGGFSLKNEKTNA